MANELAKKSVRNIFNNIPNLAKESDSKRKIIEACEMASKLLKALRFKRDEIKISSGFSLNKKPSKYQERLNKNYNPGRND